jgi:hypothetical protein
VRCIVRAGLQLIQPVGAPVIGGSNFGSSEL